MLLDGTKKTLLNSMSKIFDDSPSRRADYGKISSTLKEDYSLQFYSTRWVENECLAKKKQSSLGKDCSNSNILQFTSKTTTTWC